MADAVVSVLVEKLLRLLSEEGQQLLELDDQFEKMKKELSYVKTWLEDAETMRKKDGRKILKLITQDLRELVYDAEDIIADCQVLFMKEKNGCLADFMSYCSPRLLKFRHKIAKRLKITNQEIDKVKERMKSFLAPMSPATITSIGESSKSRPLSYPILMEEADIVGLTEPSKDVEKWILEADGSPIVIGIVGMGGIGKTTLAQKICNRDTIKHSFKCIIFETISQHCELEDLLKRMLTKMNVGEERLKGKEVEDLLRTLRSKLEVEDEKYLVVLDDVWEINEKSWWNSLKSALPKRNSCCVIVTTRKEDVAKSMGAIDRHINRPQLLSDDDSWSLFTKIAFAMDGGRCPNSNLESIGKEIVARCRGLPLAIKVVGGMMLGKVDSEWRRIAEHLKEEMEEKKKDEPLMLSLGLSYEELPHYLKPCLLCFSMLPEDYSIQVDDIVCWWIGEGFVLGTKGRTAFEIGKECVAELVNRCVLIGDRKNALSGQLISVKIHDIVRDMIIKIARDENFTHLEERGRPELPVQSRRMGIFSNGKIKSIGRTELKKSTIGSKLRTLWAIGIGKEDVLSKNMKLCKLKRLRVLSVSFKKYSEDEDVMKDWLDGIASLLHLVYLKIGYCGLENLPDSVGNLRNLQILCLSTWYNLKMLPPTITKLDKLTSFDIDRCYLLECTPDGIERLSRLERLNGFRPTISSHKNTSRILHLKNLCQLRELSIYLESPNNLVEGELNVLSELQHLRLLVINFDCDDRDDDAALASKVNHQLSPLRNVEALCLAFYAGESTPIWLNATTFPNLRVLELVGGENIKHMDPGFWEKKHGVWKIEGVSLINLIKFEEKPERFWELPSLKTLRRSAMAKKLKRSDSLHDL